MKKALIIGASSSIGKFIVKRFMDAEVETIATFSTKYDPPPGVTAIKLNLEDEKSITDFAENINNNHKIDVAIFAASILPGANLAEYTFDLISQVMDVNFTGQAKLLQAISPAFNNNGQVIMISSISAHAGSYDPIYAASKGAISSLVKALATWMAPKIRFNAIAPGLIEDSTMFDDMSPSRRSHHVNNTPTKQLLRPEALAEVVFDICQPHWNQMNGACISLNGGRHVL